MEILIFTLVFILFYAAQMIICCVIHSVRATRIPTGFIDFIKLTFLPYVLANKET